MFTFSKVHLKTAIARMQLQRNKMGNVVKVQKRAIAALLESGKDESARIKVEHIIREDFLMEALEILELFCELLLARAPVIESQKELPTELSEAIHTLLYASYRVDVQELGQLREDLELKYGKTLKKIALENTEGSVNPRVINKLATAAPEQFLVIQYLKEIAKQHNVDWQGGDWQSDLNIIPLPPMGPSGGPGNGGMMDPRMNMLQQPSYISPSPQPQQMKPEYSGPTFPNPPPPSDIHLPEYYGSGDHRLSPMPPHTQTPSPLPPHQDYHSGPPPPPFGSAPPSLPPSMSVLPPPSSNSPHSQQQQHTTVIPDTNSGAGGDGLPDFDELTRRFEALKKR
jgi:vacuolar protein sorting-associated protein IST1